MEIRYLWRLVVVHHRFITIASLVAALGGLTATYLLPEKYQASTTILIRPERRVEFTPAQQSMLGFPPGVSNPPETISQTYASMMTSTAVATRVVAALALDQPAPEPVGSWYSRGYHWARDSFRRAVSNTWDFVRFGRVEAEDAYTAAVQRVRRGLHAEPVKDTYLFSLTATWDDGPMAARIANTAAQVFTQYAEEARRAEGDASFPFFETQLATLRSRLAEARDRLAAYRAENNVASLDQQIDLSLKTLAGLEASHEDAVNQGKEAHAALAEIDQLLARETQELHTSAMTAPNPVAETLREQVARDQVRLAALQETETSAHPDVRALTASIDAAQRRIAAESARINARDTSELNPFYRALKQQRLDRSVAAQALAARVSALDASIGRYRAQVTALSGHRGDLSRLELETQTLENEYRQLTTKSEEARLAAAQEISDLRALAPAIPPQYPTSPIKLFYAGGGFTLGLIGALFVLLASDYANPRIRTVEDVTRVIGVPTLEIPGVSSSRSVADLLGDSAGYEGMISRMAARHPRDRATP